MAQKHENVPPRYAEAFIMAEFSPLDISPSDWIQHKSDRDPEVLG